MKPEVNLKKTRNMMTDLLLYILLRGTVYISTNKVAAEEVPLWVPLEQKVVKDVCRLNSSTHLHN